MQSVWGPALFESEQQVQGMWFSERGIPQGNCPSPSGRLVFIYDIVLYMYIGREIYIYIYIYIGREIERESEKRERDVLLEGRLRIPQIFDIVWNMDKACTLQTSSEVAHTDKSIVGNRKV